MTIEFVCPGCQRRLTVPLTFAGKQASCPECGRVAEVPVPMPGSAEAEIVAEVVPPENVVTTPMARPEQKVEPPAGKWLLRTPEGLSYGPVSRAELEEWVRQGRVTSDCDVRCESESLWQSADKVFPALSPWTPGGKPPTPVNPAKSLATPPANSSIAADQAAELAKKAPDRGILILTLGIVGLVVQCPVFSIMAWVMGTADVQEMRAGRMDLDGLASTQWGRILGMLVSLVWLGLAVMGTAWALYLATL